MEKNTEQNSTENSTPRTDEGKTKPRQGSGYLKQLYSTARSTAGSTHSHLKNLTTFLVNFVPVDKVLLPFAASSASTPCATP